MLSKKQAKIHPQHLESTPQWTQDEAIAYECARETIGGMIAICSALMDAEEKKEFPDLNRIAELNKKQSVFANERKNLRLKQHATIERVTREYGAKIKSYHKNGGSCPL